jgi:hypothetical protein
LRPGGRRLAGDGGSGERTLGITVVIRLLLEGPEPAGPAEMSLDTPHGSLQNVPHLPGLQVPKPLPQKLATLLVPRAIHDDGVQVGVEPHVG